MIRFFCTRSLLLIFLAVASSGCGMLQKNVRAFERRLLSEEGMEFIVVPMDEVGQQHMLNAREGSVGGFGGAGGGCGCN